MKILYDLILPILLATLISLSFSKSIKKYPIFFYLGGSIVALTSSIYEVHKLITHGSKLSGFLYYAERMSLKGFLALGFFLVLMFCGATSNKSFFSKRIKPIRGELAILGFILMIPHFIVYITKFILKFISPKDISLFNYIYIILGFIAFLILIPLVITSFRKIKRRITFSTWVKIQKFSYFFLFTIYLHIIFILISAKEFNILKFIIYNIIFLGYFTLRILSFNSNNRKRQA